MSGLFFQLGRKLGHAAVPTARKARSAWRLMTGSSEESLQAEFELGSAMADELLRLSQPVNRPNDAAFLDQICQRLAGALQNRKRTFSAGLVQTGTANALSLPGGFVFVDIMLFDLCAGQADELAFILGHEMGHISRRHSVDRLVAQIGLKVVSSLVMRRGALGAWWRQSGQDLLGKAYSREQEVQADEFGMRLAWGAGYDPRGGLNLLGRLAGLRESSGGLSEYFATHPPEKERVARLQRLIDSA